VAIAQDKAVTVEPVRVGRVVLEVRTPQRNGHVSHAHGARRGGRSWLVEPRPIASARIAFAIVLSVWPSKGFFRGIGVGDRGKPGILPTRQRGPSGLFWLRHCPDANGGGIGAARLGRNRGQHLRIRGFCVEPASGPRPTVLDLQKPVAGVLHQKTARPRVCRLCLWACGSGCFCTACRMPCAWMAKTLRASNVAAGKQFVGVGQGDGQRAHPRLKRIHFGKIRLRSG
jgi:hypothetical protein